MKSRQKYGFLYMKSAACCCKKNCYEPELKERTILTSRRENLQSLSFLGYPEILFQFIVMEVLPL